MITEKLTPEELSFCENFYNPLCLAETLFSNYDSLSEFKENLTEIRMYQIPMLSFSPILDDNIKGLSTKEKFELKKGADEIYNFGGRRFGKSLIGEKIDICLSMLYADNCWTVFSSADAIHLADILDCITKAVDFHPLLRAYKMRFRASPKYDLQCKNGYLLQSVNQNIASKDSGKQWYGKHCQVQILEESSLENSASYDKRKDAISELGVVIRSSGMTNFTRFTPAGKAYYDPNNKSKILNLPQYVNVLFDDKEDKERQIEFGGRDSPLYKIFVQGSVIEDGISEFQMDRIEPYVDDKQDLKVFEIKKEAFPYFKNLIVVERPTNAERIFISADVGDGSGGSEILIHSEIGNKYNYLYRISLYSLTDLEQYEIFDYLIQKLSANVVALDNGDGTGRAIYRRLEKKYPSANLVSYRGGEKIGVDWKKDDKGKVLLENGKPVMLDEFMSEFSIRHLKSLLYTGRIQMPTDHKYLNQLNSVISRTVGTRTVYACISATGDHIIDAHKVFATAIWLKKDFNSTPKLSVDSGLGACSWSRQPRMNIDKNKWQLKLNNKEILEISKEDYLGGMNKFLQNELIRYSLENKKDLLEYLQNQITKLDELYCKD